jgi:hypothetical protein
MMRSPAHRYNREVIGVWGRGAALALFVLSCFLFSGGAARADESSYAVGPSPIVRVLLTTGKLTIQTGDGPQVSVASAGVVGVQHLGPNDPGAVLPPDIVIPAENLKIAQGTIAMVRENFVLPALPGGPHDVIVVRGQGDTTIFVPRGTAMVFAHLRAGHITIQNYNGVFVAFSRAGAISLNHVSGTGFVQSMRGTVTADNSSFTRLRARTAIGDMLFRGCTSNQIEASSTYGSIVYDNGQFAPGLARFESQYGNVGLGVQNQSNGVQIGAHSGSGRIVSNFADGTQVSGSASDTEARVRGGGPVVTTSSQNGSVYLYNGAMSAHPSVQQNIDTAAGGSMSAPPSGYPGSAVPAGARMAPARMAPGRYQQAPRGRLPSRYIPPSRAHPAPAATPKRKHPPR